MAEDKKTEGGGLATAIPITAVIAIVASLLFAHSQPYEDERPSTKPLSTRHVAAQDVDARLWQDPFAAVDGANDNAPPEKVAIMSGQATHASSHDPGRIYSSGMPTPGEEITIFAVTMPGGSYQEDAETRMRWRYAVLSALANRGGVPNDEQHIGYFLPDRVDDLFLQKRVPFEWWVLPEISVKPGIRQKVLLLWVDETSLFDRPAAKLRALMCQARPGAPPKDTRFNYVVIGPNSSTLLRDMLVEAGDGKQGKVTPCAGAAAGGALGKIAGRDMVYYVAGATAADADLLRVDPASQWTVSTYLASWGIRLYRMIATESETMDVLVRELELRQVKGRHDGTGPGQGSGSPRAGQKDHVVILSEWDTFYGRAMPKAFGVAWGGGRDSVHVYGYMRGLDGKLPDGIGKAGGGTEKKSDGKDKPNPDASIELPEGQNQKDYLRRLAGNILELDRYLKDSGNPKGIAAVGVLGSDVHDKLMILEALRQHFPHKLFFTTDLDAAYSHPAKWPQTRNLLVASAFDLRLRHELQGGIPPFRDSYQTAFFYASNMALLGRMFLEPPNGFDNNYSFWVGHARLFEIGRGAPVLLPAASDEVHATHIGRSEPCDWEALAECHGSRLQPRFFASLHAEPGRAAMATWGMLIVMAVLLYMVSWRARGVLRKSLSGHARPVLLMGFVMAGIAAGWLADGVNAYFLDNGAEPFYWFEGVSIWPGQILRLSIVLVALAFLIWGRWRIGAMHRELEMQPCHGGSRLENGGGTEQESSFALPSEADRLGDCDVLFAGSWKVAANTEIDGEKAVFPAMLWKKYLGYRYQRKWGIPGGVARVFVHLLVFFCLALLVFKMSSPPNIPARGAIAFNVNKFVILLAVFATIALAMWVVENARLCNRLVANLAKYPSRWNGHARDWAIHRRKVAPECVEDWLDIHLVSRLTDTLQPLIWGPMVCIGLLILARSPVIDDWDIPWGLVVVFMFMLLYAISAEIYLQRGAKAARIKAIDQLSRKIDHQRNQPAPDKVAIERIEQTMERIRGLREGAFKPWYEWPLLRSAGGVGMMIAFLQYMANLWEKGVL